LAPRGGIAARQFASTSTLVRPSHKKYEFVSSAKLLEDLWHDVESTPKEAGAAMSELRILHIGIGRVRISNRQRSASAEQVIGTRRTQAAKVKQRLQELANLDRRSLTNYVELLLEDQAMQRPL
jgi:hypothetical protein